MSLHCNRRTQLLLLTGLILLVLLVAFLAGRLIPDSAVAADFAQAKEPPSWSHPFGTDHLGRDLFLRTLKGLSTSLTVGICASAISAVAAVLIGIAAATGSRAMDSFINWLIDLVMGVPHTVLVILISFACGRGLKGLLIGVAATHWTSLARLIRAPAPEPTVCGSVPAAGKVQRLDSPASSAAPFGAPVSGGPHSHAPPRHFA